MNQLAKIQNLTAVEVFQEGNAESLISDIENEVRSFVPDLKTVKGRDSIKSLAAKVSKSKTFLDGLGKNLVKEWKDKAKVVDTERKLIRDRLDQLRDDTRQPLTDYENEAIEKAAAEFAAKKMLEDHEAALIDDDFFNRQRDVERREAELLRIENERLAKLEAEEEAKRQKELAEKQEAERVEREKQIAENARIEAERVAAIEKAAAEQKIIDAKAAIEREKVKAKQAAEQVEADRLQAIKDAEENARLEAVRVENARIEKENAAKAEAARLKAIADKKAANKRHQGSVNRSILKRLTAIGVSEQDGKEFISSIALKEIPELTINY